jgi:hypothetical protein
MHQVDNTNVKVIYRRTNMTTFKTATGKIAVVQGTSK